MKKSLIIILIIILIGSSFYLLEKKSNLEVVENKTKFFSKDEILKDDLVIKITKDGFTPEKVIIKKGVRVVWINESANYVWPASDPHPTHGGYSGFDPEEPFKNGEVWGFVFNNVGKWGYHDHLSPNHRGFVEVMK